MADSSSNGNGDTGTTDYSSWTWKQILAAITGQDADHPENNAAAPQLSNPQTLQDAADTFWYVEQVLQAVGKNVSDQTEALTGQHGPWQGAAAKALNSAMTSLSKQVKDMADTLSGGITGDENVPQQLANNAQHLREAIAKLEDIDSWYANQALKINPSLMMSNGMVEVHKLPQVVNMMTNDMRQVLTTLATHYKVTQDSVAQPKPPTNPANGNPYGPNYPYYGGPSPYYTTSVPNYNAPNYNVPNYNTPYYNPNDPYSGVNNPNNPLTYNPNALSPYPGGNGLTNPNDPNLNANGPTAGNDTPFYTSVNPNGVKTTDPNAQPSGIPTDLSGPGTLDTTPVNSPLDQNAAQFPGDTSLGQSGNGLPANGVLDPAMDAALNPGSPGTTNSPNGLTSDAIPTVSPFPNLGLGSDSPQSPANASNLLQKSADPYSGNLGLDTPGVNTPGLSTSGLNDPASVSAFPGGTGLPNVDTSGTAAPGSLSGYPGTGLGADAPTLPTSSLETATPGTGLTGYPGASGLGTAGESMPMMPMGGMGAGGLGGAGSEGTPSDASGLLGGDAAPWKGSSALSDVPGEVTGGVGKGGPGLSLPQDGVAADGLPGLGADGVSSPESAVGEPLGEPGMPMMPMGGMGAGGLGGAGSEGTPSDASGLLGGDAAPWKGSSALSDVPGEVTGGVGKGGPGLSLPQDGVAADGLPGLGADGVSSPESAVGEPLGEPGMPMMPMGGMGAGAGSGEREHQRSDASGLLFGTTEPWSGATPEEGAEIGSPHGAAPAEGHLRLPADDGESGAYFPWLSEPEPQPGAEPAPEVSGSEPAVFPAAEAFAAGLVEGLPFAAAAGAAAATAGQAPGEGTGGEHPRPPQVAAASAWGEPEWGTAELSPPAPADARPRRTTGAPDEPATSPEHRGEPDVPAEPEPVHRPAAPEAGQVPGEPEVPEAADDAATWDSAPDSLFPLFGVPAPGTGGDPGAADEGARQDAAAATAVAAGAYAIAHAVAADQTLGEPARPAWRPKASGPGPMELTCAFDEPDDESDASGEQDDSEAPAEATTRGKGRRREEDEGQSSIADLLRQGEDVWGGGTGGAGVFG